MRSKFSCVRTSHNLCEHLPITTDLETNSHVSKQMEAIFLPEIRRVQADGFREEIDCLAEMAVISTGISLN